MPTVSKYPSLERSPGKADNWVEKSGGLPAYIDKIARTLHHERGMTISRAIATAVSMCKRWAAGTGNVNADTRAKAAAAVAQWEAKRVASKARTAVDLAQPDDLEDDDTMVALMLDGLELPGLELDNPHVTLAFLGGTSLEQAQAVADRLKRRVARSMGPLYGQLAGLGEFPAGPNGIPYYAPVDMPGLELLREAVVQAVDSVPGVNVRRDHGFTPHMTLRYGGQKPAPVKPTKVGCAQISVVRGGRDGQRVDIPLGETMDFTGRVDVNELVDLSELATDDETLDLAPGDYRPPYDWKHGFIPLTPAAALSKAKKGPHAGKGRARAPKGVRMPGKSSGAAASSAKRPAGAPQSKGVDALANPSEAQQRMARSLTDAELRKEVARKSSKPATRKVAQDELDRRAKARDDAQRGRGTPGETTSTSGGQGRDSAFPVNQLPAREKREYAALDTDSQRTAYRRARLAGKSHREAVNGSKSTSVAQGPASTRPAPAETRRMQPDEVAEGDTIVEPPIGSLKGSRMTVRKAYAPRSDGSRNVDVTDEQGREKSITLQPGRAVDVDTSGRGKPDNVTSIADRINARAQAQMATPEGRDASGASSTSKAKGYRDLDGPRLVDEANKRGLGGKEMLSRKSDAQLRTMLKDHDRNPSASHEDNARRRAEGADSNGITVGPADAQVSAPGTWTARRRDDGTVQVLSKNGVELGTVRQITAGKRKGQWEARTEGRKGADYGKTPEQAIDGLYDSFQGKPGAAREQRAADNNATPRPGDQGSTAIGTRPNRGASDTPATLDTSSLRNIPDETLDRNIQRYEAAQTRARATSPATAESPTLKALKAERARRDAGDTVTDATRKRRRDREAADGNARYLAGQRERRDNTPPGDLTDTQLEVARAQSQAGSARQMALKAEQDRRKAAKAPVQRPATPSGPTDPGPSAPPRDRAAALGYADGRRPGAVNADGMDDVQAYLDAYDQRKPFPIGQSINAQGVPGATSTYTGGRVVGYDGDNVVIETHGTKKRHTLPRRNVTDIATSADVDRNKVLKARAREAGRSAGSSDAGQTTSKGTGRFADRGQGKPAENDRQATFRKAQEASQRGDHAEAANLYEQLGNRPDEVERERAKAIRNGGDPGTRSVPAGTDSTPPRGRISPETARKMSDDQLERAMERLMGDGTFTGPSFAALEAELNRRDDERARRRAEGNRPRR